MLSAQATPGIKLEKSGRRRAQKALKALATNTTKKITVKGGKENIELHQEAKNNQKPLEIWRYRKTEQMDGEKRSWKGQDCENRFR